MQMDPSYCFEKEVLVKLLEAIKNDTAGTDDLGICLNLCEMTQDWRFAMFVLSHHGSIKRSLSILDENNTQDKYEHLIKYCKHIFMPSSQKKLIMTIKPSRYQTWLSNEWEKFSNYIDPAA